MNRKIIYGTITLILGLSLFGFKACAQTGSVDGKAAHIKLNDSTLIVTPSGHGTLSYFSQDAGGTWKIWENGVKYDLKTFGTGGLIWPASAAGALTNDGLGHLSWAPASGSLSSLSDVSLSSLTDAQLLQYRTSDSKWHNFTLSGDITVSNSGVSAIGTGKVTNNMLAGSIAYSKLILTGAILNSDLAGSIAYSKLSLTGSIVNADLVNSSITINGNSVSLGGSTTVTANLSNSLSVDNSSLQFNSGTTFDGSAAKTISVKSGGITDAMLTLSYIKTDGTRAFTGNQSLGGFKLTNVKELDITGTAGAGFVNLISQSSDPAQPSGSVSLFSNSGNHLSWKTPSDNFSRTLTAGTLTASRVYTLRDFSGSFLIDNGINTLSGLTTITANTMGWLNVNGTGTATANNQYFALINPVSTLRSTTSDAFQSIVLKPQINTAANTQNLAGVVVDADLHLTGGVNTFTALQSNTTTGCTNGTTTAFSGYIYTNQDGTGGSATGVTFDVTVSGNTISSIVKNGIGTGVKIGDKFLFNGSSFGGSGSVFIEIVSLDKTISTSSGALRIINRTYVPPLASVVTPVNKFIDFQVLDNTGTPSSRGYIGWYINGGSTSTFAIGDNNGEIFSANASVTTFTRPISGSTSGTFGLITSTTSTEGFTFGTNLTGGIGTGKNFYNNPVTIRPNAGSLKFATLANNTVINTGVPTTKVIASGGSGYTNGTYNGSFTVTGGSGTGLLASQVIVSGGVVISVTLSVNTALNYKATDTGLTIANTSIGGTGSGLSISITGIDYSSNYFATVYDHTSGTDNGSPNIYLSLYSDKTVNQLSGATGYDAFIEDNRTITASVNLYSILVRPTAALSGVGLGASNPLSTWEVGGSMGNSITLSTGNLTLDATHHTIIITSGTGTYTLPSASGATRRWYRIVNQTGSARTISSYIDKSGVTQTTITANSSLTIQSDGSNWYQLN